MSASEVLEHGLDDKHIAAYPQGLLLELEASHPRAIECHATNVANRVAVVVALEELAAKGYSLQRLREPRGSGVE